MPTTSPSPRWPLLAFLLALLTALGLSATRAAPPPPVSEAPPVAEPLGAQVGEVIYIDTYPGVPNVLLGQIYVGWRESDYIFSQDDGRSWQPFPSGPWESYPQTDIYYVIPHFVPALTPGIPFEMVVSIFPTAASACGQSEPLPEPFGLYRSNDLGRSWQYIPGQYGRLVASPVQPTRLYSSYAHRCEPSAPGEPTTYEGATQRSDDGGRTWTTLPLPVLPNGFTMRPSPVLPNRVYSSNFADAEGNGWRQSDDAGATWTPRRTFYPSFIVWDAVHADWMYGADDNNGIRYSRDGGHTWQPTASQPCAWLEDTSTIMAHPTKSAVLYVTCIRVSWPLVPGAGGEITGFFRSLDGGQSWHYLMEWATSAHDFVYLYPDWSTPGHLLRQRAGAWSVSSDDGDTWSDPLIHRWVLEPDLFFPLIAR